MQKIWVLLLVIFSFSRAELANLFLPSHLFLYSLQLISSYLFLKNFKINRPGFKSLKQMYMITEYHINSTVSFSNLLHLTSAIICVFKLLNYLQNLYHWLKIPEATIYSSRIKFIIFVIWIFLSRNYWFLIKRLRFCASH